MLLSWKRFAYGIIAGCLLGTACAGGPSGGGSGGSAGSEGGSGGGGKGGGGSGGGGSGGTGGAGGIGGGGAGSGGGGSAGAGASGTAGPDGGSSDAASDGAGGGGAGGSDAGTATGICDPATKYGSPLPANLTSTKVAGANFSFLEGPVWVESQAALYFSDMRYNGGNGDAAMAKIRKYTPAGGKFEIFVDASGSNGLAMHPNGKIIACTQDTQSLSFYDPAVKGGARTQVPGAGTYMGTKFTSPNDIAVRADGNIYFTDPDWQGHGGGQAERGVYRLSPAGQVTRVDTRPGHGPNGIALSPDGTLLYVGASDSDGKIKKHKVNADGSVATGTTFASPGQSDGLTVDCAGNLYATTVGSTVDIYDPTGKKIGTIAAGGQTTNVAFGGADHQTLYITASGNLYQLKMNIPGLPF